MVALILLVTAVAIADGGAIDRMALVARHNARITCATLGDDACSSVNFQTLGNGEFAFSADVTGLQVRFDCSPVIFACSRRTSPTAEQF